MKLTRRGFLGRLGALGTATGATVLMTSCASMASPPTLAAATALPTQNPEAARPAPAASEAPPAQNASNTQAQEQTAGPERQRTISVSGHGRVSTNPDQARIILGVQTEAETAEQALSQNNQQMQRLLTALKDAGIAEQNIQTQGIRLQPRYDEPRPPGTEQPRLRGYLASNTVEVRVENLDRLGSVIDEAVKAGANNVAGIRFEVSQRSELLDRARAEALQDAQRKARHLASLANVELGEILSISDSSRGPQPGVSRELAVQGAAAVPIEPGTETLEAEIDVTWALR